MSTTLRSSRTVNAGEIWLARCYFIDKPGIYKYRPMAIIGLAQDGYYAVKIASSNALSLAGDYVLLDWEQEGLLKPPIARTSQVFLIQDADFGAREEALGVLSARDSEAINGLLPRKRSSF